MPILRYLKGWWIGWADEAVGRRGFWRSLPYYLLCFASAMGLVALLVAILAAGASYWSGDWSILWGVCATIAVVYPALAIGYSIYNAVKQMHVPWDRGR